MRFNINDHIRVRLTSYGRKVHRDNFEAFRAGMPSAARARFNYSAPEEDADGWSTWQMWDLMREFGGHVSLGRCPFETEIEIPIRWHTRRRMRNVSLKSRHERRATDTDILGR